MSYGQVARPNISAIAEAIGYISLYESKHDQSCWTDHGKDPGVKTADQFKNSCGTSACLAGWVGILNAPEGARFDAAHSGAIFIPNNFGEYVQTVTGRRTAMANEDSALAMRSKNTGIHYEMESVSAFATKVLGITGDQADFLYFSANDDEIVPALVHIVKNPGVSRVELQNFLRDEDEEY